MKDFLTDEQVEFEIGDKFYRMDISQLPKDCIMWTDEQFKEYFKEAFKVMSKFPIPFEEALNTRYQFKRI